MRLPVNELEVSEMNAMVECGQSGFSGVASSLARRNFGIVAVDVRARLSMENGHTRR